MDGFFLRGPAKAVLDDPDFHARSDPSDSGYDGDKDFWSGFAMIENLDVFDRIGELGGCPIRYDGYLALARHAFDKIERARARVGDGEAKGNGKPADTKLRFLSNASRDELKAKLSSAFGFTLSAGRPAGDVEDANVHSIIGRIQNIRVASKNINNLPETEPIEFEKSGIKILIYEIEPVKPAFQNIFLSAEAWVRGDTDYPFQGLEEEDTCRSYSMIMFFDPQVAMTTFLNRMPSGRKYPGWKIEKQKHDLPRIVGNKLGLSDSANGSANDSAKDSANDSENARALVKMKELKAKFISRNRAHPKALSRGGGGYDDAIIGNSLRTSLYNINEERIRSVPDGRSYRDNDTDPILTIVAMMFTFCFVDWDRTEMLARMHSHGGLVLNRPAFNIVPQGTTLLTQWPGHPSASHVEDSDNWRMKVGDIYHRNIDRVEYTQGDVYRDIRHAVEPYFLSMFDVIDLANQFQTWWSHLIIFRIYVHERKGRLGSVGLFVSAVKEGFFWFGTHKVIAGSCQELGKPETLIQRVFMVYWVNFEKQLLSTMQKSFGELKSLEDVNVLLVTVFAGMPLIVQDPALDMTDAPILSGDFREHFGEGDVTLFDLYRIGKEWFVERYLDVNVHGIMEAFSASLPETPPPVNDKAFGYLMGEVIDEIGKLAGKKDLCNIFEMYRKTVQTSNDANAGVAAKIENKQEILHAEKEILRGSVAAGAKEGVVTETDVFQNIYRMLGMDKFGDFYQYRSGPVKYIVIDRRGLDLGEDWGRVDLTSQSASQGGASHPASTSRAGPSSIAAIAASLMVVAASAFVGALRL